MTDYFEYSKQKWEKRNSTLEFKVGYLILVSTLNFNHIEGPEKLKYSFAGPSIIQALHGTKKVELIGGLEKKNSNFPVGLVKHYTSSYKELFYLRNEKTLKVPLVNQSEDRKLLIVLKERRLRRKN
ncbi:hypothetical protein O181_025922 [Austropuccinia psidii MF-1]|uniref:Uncharacterized protein n=1 Tax=Austropuccinia psidii MF-1 TaxID=1389203 RepID=A0A9Q3H0C0_9BASI|nr:hypothetical protein [Austropuccinia psidii MF-1]